MFIYILFSTVTFLVLVATTVNTANLSSALLYKFLPIILGAALAFYGLTEIGYITINTGVF
jgi:hypothetical protein